MDQVVELLRAMGATNVVHDTTSGRSDSLVFEFGGKQCEIVAIHCNDSTAALDGEVTDEVNSVRGTIVDNCLDSGEWTLQNEDGLRPSGLRTILEEAGVGEGDKIEITVRVVKDSSGQI